MDYLLFLVVVLLAWILYELLKSEKIRNPCTDAIAAESSKELIESIPEEEEEPNICDEDRSKTESKEILNAKGIDGFDDFLTYNECLSEDACDVRSAELASKIAQDGVVDEYGISVSVGDHSNIVQSKNEDGISVSSSSTDDNSTTLFDSGHLVKGEKAETTSIPAPEADVSESASSFPNTANKSENLKVQEINAEETEVSVKESNVEATYKGSPEADVLPEVDRIYVENIVVDIAEVGAEDDSENQSKVTVPNIHAEADTSYTPAINEVTKYSTNEATECPSEEEEAKIALVPNLTVDVDVDVREAKVYFRPNTESAPETVISLTFSKNETQTPVLVTNSEEVIETVVPENSDKYERVNIIPELDNSEKGEVSFSADDNSATEVNQQTENIITEVRVQENIPSNYESEPISTKIVLQSNGFQKDADTIDTSQEKQMQTYVDNIQNLTNEIQISEIRQIGFLQRKLEFTEISDEEEILYRNITKRGDEEYTEEIQTKNETSNEIFSSSVVTNEDISFGQQMATSTTITKVINMSYTTEECSSENIELKSFDPNLLNNAEDILGQDFPNGGKISLKSIQEIEDEESEDLVEKNAGKLSSSSLKEPVITSEDSILENNENMSLCPVIESDKSVSQKKKPACGVFLFGGEELLSKIKSRRVIVDEYENEENDENWRLSPTNKGLTEYKKQVTSNTTTTSQTKKTNQGTHTHQQTKSQTVSVNASQKTDAAFGLSTHLSVSSRTEDAKWTSSSEESFDINNMTSHNESDATELISEIPAFETESLIHLNKDRAKGPLRRRRPEKTKE